MIIKSKKNILYIHQYFKTPKEPGGTRSYWLAQALVKEGYNVTMLTTSNTIKNNVEKTIIDNINVIYLKVAYGQEMSIFKRLFSFSIFMFKSTYYAFLQKNVDLVFATSTPLSVGFPPLIIKKIKKTPYVFEVRDLWPEGPIELGILKNKFIQKMSYAFEKKCYKSSSLVVTLSPGMKSHITDRFPKTNAISVTNSANIKLFSSPKEIITHPQLVGKKFAIYTGNIGMVNNSELLYRTAKKLREEGRDDIVILLIGDGQQKEEIIKKSEGLNTILFLELMPKVELVNYVKNALVSIIPLNDTPILSTSSPNKLFESMAAAIPVIQTTNGWIKKMLQESQSGFTVSPTKEDELFDKLVFLADNEIEAEEIGKRGLEFARRNFDKNILSERMIKAIEKIKK